MRSVIITTALVACGVAAIGDLSTAMTGTKPPQARLSVLLPAAVLLGTLGMLGRYRPWGWPGAEAMNDICTSAGSPDNLDVRSAPRWIASSNIPLWKLSAAADVAGMLFHAMADALREWLDARQAQICGGGVNDDSVNDLPPSWIIGRQTACNLPRSVAEAGGALLVFAALI
jgi:hypothetical protein